MNTVFCSLSRKAQWTEVIQRIEDVFAPTWIATSATAFFLRDLGCTVKSLHDMGIHANYLGGKVKSLHPHIYAGILADRNKNTEMEELATENIVPIDMVMVDMYPLLDEEGFDLDHIDIGGPSALRAAAKNYPSCLPVFRPSVFLQCLESYVPSGEMHLRNWVDQIPLAHRRKLAAQVFMMMSEANRGIAYELFSEALPYGDNPTEPAVLSPLPVWKGDQAFRVLACDDEIGQRRPADWSMSWNNMMDVHQALSLFHWCQSPYVAAIMKHHHPCGIGYSDRSATEAFARAYRCDPLSAYGGVLVLNTLPTGELISELKGKFFDVVVCPPMPEALWKTWTTERPSQCTLTLPLKDFDPEVFSHQRHVTCFGEVVLEKWRSLAQAVDSTRWTMHGAPLELNETLTKTIRHMVALVSHLHSNAICIGTAEGSLGMGMGFVNRVGAISHAVKQATRSHRDIPGPWVLASDGFMPFADNIDALDGCPVQVVVQPGGSKRDDEVIAACAERHMTLIVTGSRVFFHGI